jgi:hypothetical protein
VPDSAHRQHRLGAGTLVAPPQGAPDVRSPGKRTQVEAEAARMGTGPISAPIRPARVGVTTKPDAHTPSSAPTHEASHRSAIDRARDLCRRGLQHLDALETVLVPAYRGAVGALDTRAVKALAGQIIGGVARIVDAQGDILRLVPQVDHGPRAAMASTGATDPGAPDPAQLGALEAAKAQFDGAVALRVPTMATRVSPQWLGDELVTGRVPEPPQHVGEVLVQLAYEAGLVVQLLEDADAIEALLRPSDPERRTSEPVTDAARAEALDHVEHWRSRPINFLFLRRVLVRRGLWEFLQGAQSVYGRTVAELERKVTTQAKETGTTADVGDRWDADEAHRALSYSGGDWQVTDDEASQVLEMLGGAEPHARGELVKQLHRMGRLRTLCEHLPWGAIKQLWESIPDPAASRLLEPYWHGKGGGASLGKRLQAQDHWYTNALNKFLDIATFGAKPHLDNAYDAREAGLISDGAYWSSVHKAVGRAAFVMAASTATGGIASELVGGVSEGIGIATLGTAGRVGMMGLRGAATGGVGNIAGHFATDLYDQALDGKDGFDSPSAYRRSFREGAALGGAGELLAGAAGLVPARYLPRGLRTIAQQLAATHPRLTPLLEAVRRASRDVACKVRMTVGDYLDAFSSGVPPGFRLAFAGGPVPPRIASLPRSSTLWVTARPVRDLSAPMQMQQRGDGDASVEILDVDPETGSMFDSYGDESAYADDAADWRAGDDLGQTEHEPSRELIGVAEPGKSGKLSSRRVRHVAQDRTPPELAEHGMGVLDKNRLEITGRPRHHLLSQEEKAFFEERGLAGREIDKYCVEVDRLEHQLLHGGGSQTLARKHWPEHEWTTALVEHIRQREYHLGRMSTRDEVLRAVDELRERFEIADRNIIHYRGKRD